MDGRGPSLAAAAALHALVAALLLLRTKPPPLPLPGAPVPITLVADGPTTDSRPAEAAPTPSPAEAPAPAPKADIAPAQTARPAAPPPPPTPQPKPAPSPKPKPSPLPKPAAKTEVQPARPAKPIPPVPSLDLDALKASLPKSRSASSAAPRPGATHAETAPIARVAAGQGVSQSDKAGLSELLNRLWNPNCSALGEGALVVPVSFQVGANGRIEGRVSAGGREASGDPVVFAAARRAIDAVHRASPYAPVYRGASFRVIFDAKTACSHRD
ncbi:MAG: energy transducer TonB [Caulobacteraceae bacterium]|nr:energy transducer TonB [Caulobacteraceae bacterium]